MSRQSAMRLCVCVQKVQLKYHETTPGKVLINHEALQYPGQSGAGDCCIAASSCC